MSGVIAPIVEGQGDELAIPSLIFRISASVRVARAVRVPKTKLVEHSTRRASDEGVERAVRIASSNIADDSRGLLLLLIDGDADCAATLGPSLLESMQRAARGVECFVAVAVRGFESWIVGGVPEINEAQPEQLGAPQDRIRQVNSGRYRKTADQKAFASRIDASLLADRSPSFARLLARIREFESAE